MPELLVKIQDLILTISSTASKTASLSSKQSIYVLASEQTYGLRGHIRCSAGQSDPLALIITMSNF